MKQEQLNEIIKKSKTKNNGVYSHKGILYAVKSKFPVLFAYSGSIKQFSTGFLIILGKDINPWDYKKELKRLLEKI